MLVIQTFSENLSQFFCLYFVNGIGTHLLSYIARLMGSEFIVFLFLVYLSLLIRTVFSLNNYKIAIYHFVIGFGHNLYIILADVFYSH